MDKQIKKLYDIINHPNFVLPPAYSPKTLRLCGLKLKDAEESIKYWEEQGCFHRSELGPKDDQNILSQIDLKD